MVKCQLCKFNGLKVFDHPCLDCVILGLIAEKNIGDETITGSYFTPMEGISNVFFKDESVMDTIDTKE